MSIGVADHISRSLKQTVLTACVVEKIGGRAPCMLASR
jgi:hypothetical protein